MLHQRMKSIIDISEALGPVETPQGSLELCVTAEAGYDEEAGRLVVQLGAFLRPTGLLVNNTPAPIGCRKMRRSRSPSHAKSHEVARENFQR